jgi:hypothetical protein
VHTLTPNEHEAAILTGERDAERAGRKLLDAGCAMWSSPSGRRHAGQRPGDAPFSSSEGKTSRYLGAELLYRLVATGCGGPVPEAVARACGPRDRDHRAGAQGAPCLAGKRLTEARSRWLAIGRRVR